MTSDYKPNNTDMGFSSVFYLKVSRYMYLQIPMAWVFIDQFVISLCEFLQQYFMSGSHHIAEKLLKEYDKHKYNPDPVFYLQNVHGIYLT